MHRENERSLAVLSDRAHYGSDVWTNGLGAVGMLAVWYTGKPILDAAFGLVGSIFLLHAAYPVLIHSTKDILQSQVDPKLQQKIIELALTVDAQIQGIHRLRSRQSGPTLLSIFTLNYQVKCASTRPTILGNGYPDLYERGSHVPT